MNVSIGGIAKTVEITSFDKLGDVKVCMITNLQDGAVGFQLLSQDVINAIYNSYAVDLAQGAIASFPDGADGVPVKDLSVSIAAVQTGTGDPAPDNIRPITGWTGANVITCGTNLFASDFADWKDNYYLNNNGNAVSTSGYRYTQSYTRVKSDTLYTLRLNKTSSANVGATICFYTSNKTFISRSTIWSASADEGLLSGTFTTPNDTAFVRFSIARTSESIQIEEGATPAAFKDGTLHTVSWSADAGTVYSGTFDVTTGLLTVTSVYHEFDGTEEFTRQGSSGSYFYRWYPDVKLRGSNNQRACSHFKNATITTGNSNIGFYAYNISGTTGSFQFRHPDYVSLTADDFKAWVLSEYTNGTPLQAYAELDVAVTYQLTGAEIVTLWKQNNMWADCGDTSVLYRVDTTSYIQRLTGNTEDDMVANQNISANQYFMVGNRLYYSTAAIASDATIIPGTNCTEMTLADALNALNQ